MPGDERQGIRHPLLTAAGLEHGFGTRSSVAPDRVQRPRQVHGIEVVQADREARIADVEADAVVTAAAGCAVGVVTADCVPVLVGARDSHAVAAIHAGWRGLAAGVVEAGIHALREHAGPGARLFAAIGPHIGQCCYEVDEPVLDAMTQRFKSGEVEAACVMTRPGHARIDLGALTARALEEAGVEPAAQALLAGACTACDAERFHSFRRDGAAAGRLLHYIVAPGRDGPPA